MQIAALLFSPHPLDELYQTNFVPTNLAIELQMNQNFMEKHQLTQVHTVN